METISLLNDRLYTWSDFSLEIFCWSFEILEPFSFCPNKFLQAKQARFYKALFFLFLSQTRKNIEIKLYFIVAMMWYEEPSRHNDDAISVSVKFERLQHRYSHSSSDLRQGSSILVTEDDGWLQPDDNRDSFAALDASHA